MTTNGSQLKRRLVPRGTWETFQCKNNNVKSCKTSIVRCKKISKHSRVSNRRDSPLINYSVVLPSSATLFSTPRLLILENFASLPFYSRPPVY